MECNPLTLEAIQQKKVVVSFRWFRQPRLTTILCLPPQVDLVFLTKCFFKGLREENLLEISLLIFNTWQNLQCKRVFIAAVRWWEIFWVQNSWDQGIFEGNRWFLRFYITNIHYADWIANLLSILMQKQGNNEWTVLETQIFQFSVQHLQALFSKHQDLCFHTLCLELGSRIMILLDVISCWINFWAQKVSTIGLPSQQGRAESLQMRAATFCCWKSCTIL